MTRQLVIECQGEQFVLSDERAVYWQRHKTLFVADWHLGKAAVFGRRGLAIPDGDLAYDLERLDELLSQFDIERLMVLGDLMHAPPVDGDRWPLQLASWLSSYAALSVEIIAGNHDRIEPTALPDALSSRLSWHTASVTQGPFMFAHEPSTSPDYYVIAGHLHPTRRLFSGADRVRAPAFWFREHYAVLPAFGSFTGGENIKPTQSDRVFLTGPGAVIEVSKNAV